MYKKKHSVNEIQAIKACVEDAVYFLNMVNQLRHLKEESIIIMRVISELAMFVVESYETLTKVLPETKILFDKSSIEELRKIRHRIKLLESQKDIKLVLETLKEIDLKEVNYFKSLHTGALSSMKRFMQPDMGIMIFENHYIATTHTIKFFLGHDVQDMSSYGFAIGESIGSYLAVLTDSFDIDDSIVLNTYEPNSDSFKMVDIKREKLYRRSMLEEEIWYTRALILILVRLNYTRFITANFFSLGSLGLLRLKFISAFHAISSLCKVQSLVMKAIPNEKEKLFFKSIFACKSTKWLLKQSSLRNLFTHYLLDNKQIKRMPEVYTREEAIKIISGGLDLHEIETKVDTAMQNVAFSLEEVFNLKKNTFWLGRMDL